MISLKLLRKSAGYTQAQLASLSNVPQSVISDLQTGVKKDPAISTVLKIASALNCSVQDIVKETEEDSDGKPC